MIFMAPFYIYILYLNKHVWQNETWLKIWIFLIYKIAEVINASITWKHVRFYTFELAHHIMLYFAGCGDAPYDTE